MSLYNRILGHPFVYNRVRPLVVGGIDASPVYKRLETTADDVVLDVGCGTGAALEYLDRFKEYWGFDIDDVAVSFARKRFGSRPGVHLNARLLDGPDVESIAPTSVVLAGLLHHLTDEQVLDLLCMVGTSSRLRRVVSQDIVFLPGRFVSNFFAKLDRGRYCRRQEQYEQLVKEAGFQLVQSSIIPSHPTNGRALYLIMTFEPASRG